jgi:imidazolonepropionase-like amidohydrolase
VIVALVACRGNRTTLSAGGSALRVMAIVNATVVPMDSERVIRDATVIVRGDRIIWVGPGATAKIPADAERVDARGAFVLPGLADLHVHTEERDLPLYLRNGVTTIRELNGSAQLLALRDRIRHGELAGPTMHVAGTLLAGTKQPWRHVLITTPNEARAAVREHAAAGYEFIKAYSGLSAESYAAIVDEAARLRIRVIGHVPQAVGLAGVLAAKQAEIEHLDQIFASTIYRDTTNWRTRIDSIARAIAAAGTWVNPTLAVEEGLSRTGTAWYAAQLQRPEMKLVDSATMAWWSSLSGRRSDSAHTAAPASADEYPSARARAIVAMKRYAVASFDSHGVQMLMGSDLPNPLMVPGFALHDELSALVGAGLTPFRAIATATRNASTFMGGDRFGVIAPGARADLIVVARNPLEDVQVLRSPSRVLVRGRWVTQ